MKALLLASALAFGFAAEGDEHTPVYPALGQTALMHALGYQFGTTLGLGIPTGAIAAMPPDLSAKVVLEAMGIADSLRRHLKNLPASGHPAFDTTGDPPESGYADSVPENPLPPALRTVVEGKGEPEPRPYFPPAAGTGNEGRAFRKSSPELPRSLRELGALLAEASRSARRRVARSAESALGRRERIGSAPHLRPAPRPLGFTGEIPPPGAPLSPPAATVFPPPFPRPAAVPGGLSLAPFSATALPPSGPDPAKAQGLSARLAKALPPKLPLPPPSPELPPPDPPATLSAKWAGYASLPKPLVIWGELKEPAAESGGTGDETDPGTDPNGEGSEGTAGTSGEGDSASGGSGANGGFGAWFSALPAKRKGAPEAKAPSRDGDPKRGPSRIALLAARAGHGFSWLVPERSDFVRFAGERLGLEETTANRLYEAIRALAWIATVAWIAMLLRQGRRWLLWFLTPAPARSRRRYASGRTSAR